MVRVEDLNTSIFTSGQVAKICRVGQNTAIKWMDTGLLKNYRLPTSGKPRRVTKEALLQFVREHNIPTEKF